MYSISLSSEKVDDLKLIILLAKRMGIQASDAIKPMEEKREYQIGLEQGIVQGIEQGLIEGIERGALNKAFELARNMKASGFDKRTILDITHLIAEDIDSL